ncbi:MAG: hypothetical protein J5938_00330 [Clostridia bacterium]|nr:hypothetical protein [Clostridia bacterium]
MRRMIRILSVLTALALLTLSLVSCGVKELTSYTFEDTKQYLELGQFKGLELKQSEIDEAVNEEVDSILSANTSLQSTGKPAEEGDRVTLSATCTVDGKTEDSLAISETTVLAGGTSPTKIAEINDILIGLSKDDVKEVSALIPDGYTSDDAFKGKEAVFTVTVADVKANVKPTELTDEMVSESSSGLYTTVEAFLEETRKSVMEDQAFSLAYSLVTFKDPGYPRDLAERNYNQQMEEYKAYASQLGISLEYLAQLYGVDLNTFCGRISQNAIGSVKRQLVLTAICRSENIQGTEEDLNDLVNSYIQGGTYADADAVYRAIGKDNLQLSADWSAAFRFLRENAVVTDDTGSPNSESESEQETTPEA